MTGMKSTVKRGKQNRKNWVKKIAWFIPLLLIAAMLPSAHVMADTYSSFSAANVTTEGYDIYIYGVTDPKGVTKVQMPTWSEFNGQTDIIWYNATKQSDGTTWKCHVNRSEHNGDYGKYDTDFYVTNGAGTQTCHSRLYVTLAPNVSIQNMTVNGYDVVVSNITNMTGLTSVKFPTWTAANGQDDIIWGTGTSLGNGQYSYHVARSDHNNEYGGYNTHVYAIVSGVQEFLTVGYSGYCPGSRICIDTPQGGANVAGSVNIGGWAINYMGTQKINVYLDGTLQGQATKGVSRTDVNNTYPGYGDGANCGFNYTLSLIGVSQGTHTIMVESVSNDSNVTQLSENVYIYPDVNEPTDNTASGANSLSPGLPVSARIYSSSDVDYYKISKDPSATDFIEAKLTNPAGKYYTVTLLDPSQNTLTTAQISETSGYVRAKVKTAGTYYVKISGDSTNYDPTNTYTLTVQ